MRVGDPSEVSFPHFTFKVQLDETGRSFDLQNRFGENLYSAAKKNDLPIAHLDEVANFIAKNVGLFTTSEQAQEPSSVPVKPEYFVVEALMPMEF